MRLLFQLAPDLVQILFLLNGRWIMRVACQVEVKFQHDKIQGLQFAQKANVFFLHRITTFTQCTLVNNVCKKAAPVHSKISLACNPRGECIIRVPSTRR